MKHLAIVLVCAVLLFKPSQTSISQTRTPLQGTRAGAAKDREPENAALRKTITANQGQIDRLIRQIPGTAPKAKIVYIRIYRKPPPKKYAKNFIAIEPTRVLAYVDSISAMPAITPNIKSIKKTFFQRLFHPQKNN